MKDNNFHEINNEKTYFLLLLVTLFWID